MQLSLDEMKNNNDKIVESEGVNVVFDEELEYYLDGAIIDYSNQWFRKGFSITGGKVSTC